MSIYAGGSGFDFIPSLGLPSGGGAVPPSYGLFDSRYIGPGDPRFIGPLQPVGIPTTTDPEKGSWGDVLRGLSQTAGEILLNKYLSRSSSTPQPHLAVRDKGDLGAGIERNVVPDGPYNPPRSSTGLGLPAGLNPTMLLIGAAVIAGVLIARG